MPIKPVVVNKGASFGESALRVAAPLLAAGATVAAAYTGGAAAPLIPAALGLGAAGAQAGSMALANSRANQSAKGSNLGVNVNSDSGAIARRVAAQNSDLRKLREGVMALPEAPVQFRRENGANMIKAYAIGLMNSNQRKA